MGLFVIQDKYRNGKRYNGNTFKFGVTINNVDYIVKYPKDVDMSVYCEYVCSRVISAMGVNCHEVYLAEYKGLVVNLIKDFTSGTKITLHSFKDTKQSSEDTDLNYKEYTYNDVLYLIEKHLKIVDKYKLESKECFWDMFICDAIIGNRDRHWGNWGYLSNGYSYRFAPLYDNGAGLFPGVMRVIQEYISPSTREKFIYDRVRVFPASLFKIRKPDRSYRSNYYEMFSDLRVNKIFAQRVKLFRERVSEEWLFKYMCKLVRDLPIGIIYKRFYIEIVVMRYACIVCRKDIHKEYLLVERMLTDAGY